MSLLPNGLAARTLLWWSLTGVAAAAGYLAWTYGEATRPERAQSGPAQGADPALDQQAQAVLSVVDDALKQFPPSPDPAPQRERALGDLDAVLRDAEAAHRPAVQDFFQRRIEEALAQMERTDAEHGATV